MDDDEEDTGYTLFQINDFIECVKRGEYNSYDGTGYYAVKKDGIIDETNEAVDLSNIDNSKYTHVLWYSK